MNTIIKQRHYFAEVQLAVIGLVGLLATVVANDILVLNPQISVKGVEVKLGDVGFLPESLKEHAQLVVGLVDDRKETSLLARTDIERKIRLKLGNLAPSIKGPAVIKVYQSSLGNIPPVSVMPVGVMPSAVPRPQQASGETERTINETERLWQNRLTNMVQRYLLEEKRIAEPSDWQIDAHALSEYLTLKSLPSFRLVPEEMGGDLVLFTIEQQKDAPPVRAIYWPMARQVANNPNQSQGILRASYLTYQSGAKPGAASMGSTQKFQPIPPRNNEIARADKSGPTPKPKPVVQPGSIIRVSVVAKNMVVLVLSFKAMESGAVGDHILAKNTDNEKAKPVKVLITSPTTGVIEE